IADTSMCSPPRSQLCRHSLSAHPFLFSSCTISARSALYTLSLHDALPISGLLAGRLLHLPLTQTILVSCGFSICGAAADREAARSEEHTSELQSRFDLVCRLLLEKKKKKLYTDNIIGTRTNYQYVTWVACI